jgi:cation/acetate symporter
MALVLGTAGLPHILMRFFTVPTAQQARKSVIWAMAIIGGFYVLTLFLGLGAAMKVGAPAITEIDRGGNMAAPLLAQYLGGGKDSILGNLMLAFVAAVAFATIVAVVAGLVLAAASAMSHDIWVGVIKGDKATSEEELKAARICSLIVGVIAIAIGILAKGQNVAHLVALAFAVAASANLPVVLLTLYWKKCNTGGVVAGLVVGTLSAIGLVLVSPNMTYPLQVKAAQERVIKTQDESIAKFNADLPGLTEAAAIAKAKQGIAAAEKAKAGAQDAIKALGSATTSLVGLTEPLFPLRNPGLISIPLGFLAVLIGSLLYRDRRAEEMWEELYVRSHTGIGRAAASAH